MEAIDPNRHLPPKLEKIWLEAGLAPILDAYFASPALRGLFSHPGKGNAFQTPKIVVSPGCAARKRVDRTADSGRLAGRGTKSTTRRA
jgi:hypothetical protein